MFAINVYIMPQHHCKYDANNCCQININGHLSTHDTGMFIQS